MNNSNKKFCIIASRTDGFGERMCALLNAMVISKLLNIDFKFSWVHHYKQADSLAQMQNSWANLPTAEQLFSKGFLKKYFLQGNIIGNSSNINTKENIKNILNKNIEFENEQYYGWYSFQSKLQYEGLDERLYNNLLAECWSEIEFNDEICEIFSKTKHLLNIINNSHEIISLHIRIGDIVEHRNSIPNVHEYKVFNPCFIQQVVDKAKENNNALLVFCDNLEFVNKIKNVFWYENIIIVDELIKLAKIDYVGYKRSLLEIELMSHSKEIYCAASGFSRLSSWKSNVKLIQPFFNKSGAEKYSDICNNIETLKPILNYNQLAFIYMSLYKLSVSLGKSQEEQYDAITLMYKFAIKNGLNNANADYILLYLFHLLKIKKFDVANNVLMIMYFDYLYLTKRIMERAEWKPLVDFMVQNINNFRNYFYIFELYIKLINSNYQLKLCGDLSATLIISTNKPATQSSISQWSKPNDAIRALSGELTNEDFAFHTAEEENPWWMVDLEKEEYIYNIYIQNRIKYCKERIKTLQVEISLDKENWVLIPNEYLKWTNLDYLNVELLNKYKARYVRLSLREKNYFHLAKVEVYALNDKVIEACRNLEIYND